MKRLAILGSTGSIGTQTLKVLESVQGFTVVALSCGRNFSLFKDQLLKYRPPYAASLTLNSELENCGLTTKFFWGEDGIEKMLEVSRPDYVLIAVSGAVGLRFSLKATEVCERLCLANKESIVCGGQLLLEKCRARNVRLIPVDSEHSGLFQLLNEERGERPERIFITASGGALRDWPEEKLHEATPKDVLNHPVWSMGSRITVDSASMVNKGLEVIEAHYLFDYPEKAIETYICRNSYIHAGVIYGDGVVKLHAGRPDMRVPIAYSLTYPAREKNSTPESIVGLPLVLDPMTPGKYRTLELARAICGQLPRQIAYNAADEIAVAAFVEGTIPFGNIYHIIKETVARFADQNLGDYRQILEVDKRARSLAREEVNRWYWQ